MRPINQCLNQQLANICQKAMELDALQNKVIPLLPENLQPYCKVGSFNKGCLILSTSDAIWASQLRYLLPELRDKLRQKGFYQLSSIQIHIAENQGIDLKKPKNKPHRISEQARQVILNESADCKHEPLKKALQHLAKE